MHLSLTVTEVLELSYLEPVLLVAGERGVGRGASSKEWKEKALEDLGKGREEIQEPKNPAPFGRRVRTPGLGNVSRCRSGEGDQLLNSPSCPPPSPL